jgi:hypothetical protein
MFKQIHPAGGRHPAIYRGFPGRLSTCPAVTTALALTCGWALALCLPAAATPVAADTVDHRYYSWDSWIGAIGLPDDAFKSVADADGRFMTELRAGSAHQSAYPNPPVPHALRIQADLRGGARRVDQRMHSSHTPVSITRKRQAEVSIQETLFLARPLGWSAAARGQALQGHDTRPRPHQYLLMSEYTNEGGQPTEITPVIHVDSSTVGMNLNGAQSTFIASENTWCQTTRPVVSLESRLGQPCTLVLDKLTLAPGEKARWVLTINRDGFESSAPVDWEEAEKLHRQAIIYWEQSVDLPYATIQVPDPEIQRLLDTSIRELYQMRYVLKGLPAYYFGPGCYNDYWILDGSFVDEAMAMIGRVEDANGYADYLLLHQQADGRFQTIGALWKETGIAVYTLYRHARMIQDKEWLRKRWPQFRRGVAAIANLRRMDSVQDPKALNYRLCPVGFGDGGIGYTADFSNNHWLLAGLKAAVEAAQWLGERQDAESWEREYRDFEQTLQKAFQRDAKTDEHGNRYIPAVMGPEVPKHPTRGQWAFCQGVYPGRIFAQDDPLMLDTMKMLEAHEIQGGIIEDSGWIGVWPQCGSFYGHDWLWLGQGQRAARLLYAFANHASPVWNWKEEMHKQTRPGETFPFDTGMGGDMPHVSAAAEFIRLAGHLLAFDRGQELHLFEGLPTAWLKPGMVTRLNGLMTPFGPLTLELKVAADGQTASVHVGPLRDPTCEKVVVHVGGWTSDDARATRELAPDKGHDFTLTLRGNN